MPPFGPISRANLIHLLHALGFVGPFPGGRHAFMVRGEPRLAIPNQHPGVIGVNLFRLILRQAGISRQEWESV